MVVLVLMELRLVRMLVVLMVLNGYDAADGADAGVDADGDDVVASVLSVEVGPGSSSQPPAPRLKIYLQIPWPYS